MNSKYNDLFDDLVKSYYIGNFDETLKVIMDGHDKSPQETFKIIATLCGVDIPFDNNYVYNLKKAITHYAVNKRVIEKLEDCVSNCSKDDNDKFKCQASCPFDAITYDESKQSTVIDPTLCLNCGTCVNACKDGRIIDKVEFIPIKNLIDNNKTVIVTVAPSIIGQFGSDVTMDQLRAALIKVGFSDMIEVAFAADILTIKEAVEFNKHVNSPDDLMITSCCCPLWVGMLKKVYKNLVKDLSPSVSPMIAAGRIIKTLNKDAKVVFIGPCIAKKAEAKEKDVCGAVDFVLTYEELEEIFKILNIDPAKLNGVPSREYASRGGRLYGRAGGVSIAISEMVEELYPNKKEQLKAVKADGVKGCKELLDKVLRGEIDGNFIEGMGCIGGCVGGPKVIIPKDDGRIATDNFAFYSPIKVATHSSALDSILYKLDINSLKDFENQDKISILHREF